MSKILASIADAELGAARYVSTANRGEILERATAARAEHAEIVRFVTGMSQHFNGMRGMTGQVLDPMSIDAMGKIADVADTILSRIAPERAS